MENFYVTYDGSDPEQLRVGLSYVYEDPVEQTSEISTGAEVILIVMAVMSGFFIALVGIYICMRASKQARLAKAKAYFASLQTHDD